MSSVDQEEEDQFASGMTQKMRYSTWFTPRELYILLLLPNDELPNYLHVLIPINMLGESYINFI